MPLDPITTTALFKGFLSANLILGISSSQLAAGVANGLSTYGKTGMNVGTVDAGTAGSGKGFGIGVFIVPPVLTQSLAASFIAASIRGVSAAQLISALTLGFTQSLSVAVINTLHPSVGTGTGQLFIGKNPIVAAKTFIGAFEAAGMNGPTATNVATAIAIGLDNVLPSARGTVGIAGPPSPVPSSGFGTGKLL
jgi:hypothetical protein